MDRHSSKKKCPNKRKIQIYTADEAGNVIVKKQFLQLWRLLTSVGDFNYMGGFETTSFMLPSISESVLRGVPFLTDPSSPVKILGFKQIIPPGTLPPAPGSDFPGPI